MATLSEWERVTVRHLALLFINIHQPVRLSLITKHFSSRVQALQLRQILKELTLEGKIVKESYYYRLTALGLGSILPGKGRFIRDVQRMEYLLQQ